MKKWLLVFSVLLLGGMSYFFTTTKEESKVGLSDKQVVSVTTPKTYKDIFQDNLQVDKLKLLQQQQDIAQLNKDSAALMAEADKLIEKEHLDVGIQPTQEEQIKQEEFREKLDKKIAQLEELSNGY